LSDAPEAEIVEALRAALQDQARVILYVNGLQLHGAVARLEGSSVELREGAERVVARLDRIDAVRRS